MRTSSSSTARKRKNLSPLASVDLEPCRNYDLHGEPHLQPRPGTSQLLLLPERGEIHLHESTESSRAETTGTETVSLFKDNKILGNLETFREDFAPGKKVDCTFYEILRTDGKIHGSYGTFRSDVQGPSVFSETRTIVSAVVGRSRESPNLPESLGDDVGGGDDTSSSRAQVSALFRACEGSTSAAAVLCILRDDGDPVDQAVGRNRLADCGLPLPIDIQSETTGTRIPLSPGVADDIAAEFVEGPVDRTEARGRADLLGQSFFREEKGASGAPGPPPGGEEDLSKRREMFRRVPNEPTANLTDPVFNFRAERSTAELPDVLPIDGKSGRAFSYATSFAQRGSSYQRKPGYRVFEKYRRLAGGKKRRVLAAATAAASGKRHRERNRPREVGSERASVSDEGNPAKLDDRKYKPDVPISPREQSEERIDEESPQKITAGSPGAALQGDTDKDLDGKPDEHAREACIVSRISPRVGSRSFAKFQETQEEFFAEERPFAGKKGRIAKEDSPEIPAPPPAFSRREVEFKRCVGHGKRPSLRFGIPTRMVLLALLWVQWWSCAGAVALASGQKYSMRVIKTRYGTLRGVVQRSSTAVETYYGVPYATPPLGALRYMPPVTPTPWRGTKFADTMPPACPQRSPQPEPPLPRNSRGYLQRISPLLANQSEDCLYLNLYVPQPTIGNATALLPALLLIHGDSYAWGTGNSLDGTALAAHGRVIVVSINFRLGVLGFLKTGPKNSAQGNYGLMDLVAGLHWLRENLKAFGGDPERLVLLGHGTGAALANFLAVSPMAKELVKRVVLLGGSALSPWAVQRDPLMVKRRVAEHNGCSGDMETDDIAQCLRLRSVEELLDVELDPPRFTSGFAPFVDGTVLPQPINQNFQPTASSAGIIPLVPGPGAEFANFGDRNLMLGLTSDEAWISLNDDDMQNGLNETRRDRILRTYVRNTYRYHLHEIYSTLRNEYTDWERGEQSPYAICEGLLSLLGDGQVAAPLLRLALLHSTSGGHDYFLHFQPGDRPSRRGEELPYLLGLPLLRAEAPAYGSAGNYTAADENLSRLLVHYLANFVRRGDPNGASPLNSGSNENGLTSSPPFWDRYDSLNQLYLEVGRTTEMRSHYRGHKMSLWLNLLPQLHRPGYEISMRHHHLSESPSLYEGPVRPQTMALPLPAPPLPIPSPTVPSTIPSSVATTECTPNATAATTLPTTSKTMQNSNLGPGPNNLLRKLASSHYQSYTTALTVTIAVGVFLLLLNILIFAGIYHQRDRSNTAAGGALSSAFGDKKKEELLEAGCSGIKAVSSKQRLSALNLMESPPSSPPPHKAKLVQELELQLQDFQCSPPPGGGKRVVEPPSYSRSPCLQRTRTPSPCVDATTARMDEDDDNSDSDDDNEEIPEPPPPPKVPAPNVALACPGILRQPGTPGSAKKRVQIQEISV